MQDLGFEPSRVCVLKKSSLGCAVRPAGQLGMCESGGFSVRTVRQNVLKGQQGERTRAGEADCLPLFSLF